MYNNFIFTIIAHILLLLYIYHTIHLNVTKYDYSRTQRRYFDLPNNNHILARQACILAHRGQTESPKSIFKIQSLSLVEKRRLFANTRQARGFSILQMVRWQRGVMGRAAVVHVGHRQCMTPVSGMSRGCVSCAEG